MHRNDSPGNEPQLERYDYVPPGMSSPGLLALFPYARPSDPQYAYEEGRLAKQALGVAD